MPGPQPTPVDAQDLIDRYKAILADPHYFSDLKRIVSSLNRASAELKRTADLLLEFRIRPADWTNIAGMPGPLPAECDGYRFNLIQRIYRDAGAYEQFAWAVDLCTEPDGKHKSGKDERIPASVYDNATYDLIQRYEALTETRVRSPKPLHEGSPQQHSTAFIADCLKIIDPSFDASSALTCIKTALASRSTGIKDLRVGETVIVELPAPIPKSAPRQIP